MKEHDQDRDTPIENVPIPIEAQLNGEADQIDSEYQIQNGTF